MRQVCSILVGLALTVLLAGAADTVTAFSLSPPVQSTTYRRDRIRRTMAQEKHYEAVQTLTIQPPRPNDCTYWVTESFMAGEYPTDSSRQDAATRQKLRNYLKSGITCFINLTEEGEKPAYEEILREEAQNLNLAEENIVAYRIPIPDFGVPSSPKVMKEVLDTVDQHIGQGHKVYVHCRGGIGRTGTTVGCYLARHGYEPDQALTETHRLFQHSDRSMESYSSPETPAQVRFVQNWKD